jgi:hypothetical protein
MGCWNVWSAVAVVAVVATGSVTAAAEVPTSRVVPPQPLHELPPLQVVWTTPAERDAKIAAYHAAREFRSAGIALVSVGCTFLPLGIAELVDARHNRATGRDVSGSRANMTIGSILTTIGGVPLVLGLPMLFYGVSVKKPPVMVPYAQVGVSGGSLGWSF